MSEKLSPLQIAESLTEYWSPKIIAEVNESYVKVAKLKGEFVWHSHQYEDEMFVILQGSLTIEFRENKAEFRENKVELQQGDIYVIEQGVEHNPIANDECLVMLIETKSTLHTGDVVDPKSKSISEQLAS